MIPVLLTAALGQTVVNPTPGLTFVNPPKLPKATVLKQSFYLPPRPGHVSKLSPSFSFPVIGTPSVPATVRYAGYIHQQDQKGKKLPIFPKLHVSVDSFQYAPQKDFPVISGLFSQLISTPPGEQSYWEPDNNLPDAGSPPTAYKGRWQRKWYVHLWLDKTIEVAAKGEIQVVVPYPAPRVFTDSFNWHAGTALDLSKYFDFFPRAIGDHRLEITSVSTGASQPANLPKLPIPFEYELFRGDRSIMAKTTSAKTVNLHFKAGASMVNAGTGFRIKVRPITPQRPVAIYIRVFHYPPLK